MALGISEAQLLGVFLASVFWGMFLITFVQCMRYLLWDSKGVLKSASTISWAMLSVAWLLAALSTLDVALGLMHSIEAFIYYTGSGGSAARFTGLTDWVNILKTCNIVFGKFLSDGILIYRCWVVYNKKWLVISLPLVLWLGYLGLAIFVVYLEATASSPHVLLTGGSLSELTPSITSGWTLSIANNLIATGLIVYRLWRVDRNNALYAAQSAPSSHGFFRSNSKRTKLQDVIRIIIESGLLYTTSAFITFVTFLTGSNSFYPTSDAELQILSIAFNLIIIRISSRPDEDYYGVRSGRFQPTYALRDFTSFEQSSVARRASSKRPLEVIMRSEVDRDMGYSSASSRARESYKTGTETTHGLDSEVPADEGSAV